MHQGNSDAEYDQLGENQKIEGCKHFSHPNVLPVLEVSETLFPLYIMSPWMSDGNILQYTQKNPSANRLMLLAEACHGLSYLHGQDISHGCIAPGNILITQDGRACLGDFGISDGFSDLSFIRFKLGTARYMAPERVSLLNSSPSQKSDVYSLAVTSFTVLTGVWRTALPSNQSGWHSMVAGQHLGYDRHLLEQGPERAMGSPYYMPPVFDVESPGGPEGQVRH
ncbi:kinase-like protein [Thelephora ganbajun]|uniref:Kinase-like protein n=1 Tax=Thelephora ganbajun TaxID=370292 RepID=A0ACB6ZI48_THEGA|nr:kinase-like protein [Thelephora ganbajun]